MLLIYSLFINMIMDNEVFTGSSDVEAEWADKVE